MIPLRIAKKWEKVIAHKDCINAHILYPAYRVRERIIRRMLLVKLHANAQGMPCLKCCHEETSFKVAKCSWLDE